jgi:hypothetical protein
MSGFGATPKGSDTIPLGSIAIPDGTGTLYVIKGGNGVSDAAGKIASICFVVDTTTILNQVSAAKTITGNSADLNVSAFREVAIDANISAVSGTSPTLQLFIDRKGADGIYYQIWNSASITAVGTASDSIGPGLNKNQSLGSTIRLRWVIGGTTPSFTFSASIIGK